MTTTKQPQTTTENGYPSYPLDEAMKVAEALRDLGGSKAPVSKEFLAKHMGFAPTGPSFVQRLGAAKAFGLIDGRGEYQLTPISRKYFYPNSSSDKRAALLEMMNFPYAFNVIISRFDNGEFPPDIEIIGNIMLNNANVPESWKNKVAGNFLRSVDFAGKDTFKSDHARKVEASSVTVEKKDITTEPVEKATNPENSHSFDMPLAKGRKVTVTAPTDLTVTEMKRLQAWLPLTFLVDWNPEEKI